MSHRHLSAFIVVTYLHLNMHVSPTWSVISSHASRHVHSSFSHLIPPSQKLFQYNTQQKFLQNLKSQNFKLTSHTAPLCRYVICFKLIIFRPLSLLTFWKPLLTFYSVISIIRNNDEKGEGEGSRLIEKRR
jgi:hypothetical protein